MNRFHGTLVSSLVAIGIAGTAFAPGANATANTHAYAKSAEAAKVHESTCNSLYDGLNTAVDKGLAANKAGDKEGQAFYTTCSEIFMDAIKNSGCL